MTGIVSIQLDYLHDLLASRGISLQIDDKAKTWLGDKGYDPAYGARPLKRVIQTHLQNRLAGMILNGEASPGSRINVSVKGDELDFKISGNTEDSQRKGLKSVA